MKACTDHIRRCASMLSIVLLTACPDGGTGATGDGTDTEATGTTLTTTTTPGTSGPTTDAMTEPMDDTVTPMEDSTTEEPPTGDCRDDADCDDRMACNGMEVCVEGACVAGDPLKCTDDDAVDCTTVACDDELGCIIVPDHSMCECGETCHPELGCGNHCEVTLCTINQPYECGDCIDNDGDCLVDALDPNCWGPCDNNEGGWQGGVPGQQNQSECNIMDCYFDNDSGTGNDGCYWSHTCDELQPTWHDLACMYNPDYSPPGANPSTCEDLEMMQSRQCEDYCAPLTPNGCDCFGCCVVTLDDGTMTTIYLASTDLEGNYTCGFETMNDPDACHACTQVPSCINPCDECELCLGEVELPPGCTKQVCPAGLQVCGLPGQDPCPDMFACVTGCCVPEPQ